MNTHYGMHIIGRSLSIVVCLFTLTMTACYKELNV
jgi:hypothetical protein